MKKRNFYFSLFVLAVFLFWLITRVSDNNKSNENQAEATIKITNAESATAKPLASPTPTGEQIKERLSVAETVMKNLGFTPRPPAIGHLQEAIDSGDFIKVRVAFSDFTYHGMWESSQVITALEHFLNDPNPKIRFLAAQHLFIVGSKSGLPVMLDLMKSNDKTDGGYGSDLRIQAAEVLAKYRIYEAKQALEDVFIRVRGPDLAEALTLIGYELPNQDKFKFIADENVLRKYAKVGVTKFLPQIQQVFDQSPKSGDKLAAAWALSILNNDPVAFDYLKQKSVDNSPPIGKGSGDFCQALKYLGSIDSPESKQILESALESKIPHAVQIAIVNLIYNQQDSDKALQVIANQLNDSSNAQLPWDFTLNIASQFQDHPLIKPAGVKFVKSSGGSSWRHYTIQRKDWPIYNWIDKYVVKLKETR